MTPTKSKLFNYGYLFYTGVLIATILAFIVNSGLGLIIIYTVILLRVLINDAMKQEKNNHNTRSAGTPSYYPFDVWHSECDGGDCGCDGGGD